MGDAFKRTSNYLFLGRRDLQRAMTTRRAESPCTSECFLKVLDRTGQLWLLENKEPHERTYLNLKNVRGFNFLDDELRNPIPNFNWEASINAYW